MKSLFQLKVIMARLLSLKNLALEKTESRDNQRCGCDRAILFNQNELRKIKFLALGDEGESNECARRRSRKKWMSSFCRNVLRRKERLIVK